MGEKEMTIQDITYWETPADQDARYEMLCNWFENELDKTEKPYVISTWYYSVKDWHGCMHEIAWQQDVDGSGAFWIYLDWSTMKFVSTRDDDNNSVIVKALPDNVLMELWEDYKK